MQICLCFRMGRFSSSMWPYGSLGHWRDEGGNVLETGFGSMYWTTEGGGAGAGGMGALCQVDKIRMLLICQQQGSLSQKLTFSLVSAVFHQGRETTGP